MNLAQFASLALIAGGGVWLFSPNPSEADPGGGISSPALPAPGSPIMAKVRSALGSPDVQVPGGDGRWSQIGVSYEFVSGSVVTTGFGEELTMELPTGGTLTLESGSLMRMDTDSEGTPTFRLQRGTLTGFVEGGPVGFETPFGGAMILRPDPGHRARISLGDRPTAVIGLSQTPWIVGDWAVSDGTIFLAPIPRGINANVPTEVIPEPGTVALLAAGTALLLKCTISRR